MILQMPYLGVPTMGRLGNQLFCYMFLQTAKATLGVEVRTGKWLGTVLLDLSTLADLLPSSIEVAFEPNLVTEKTSHVAKSDRTDGLKNDLELLRRLALASAEVVNVAGHFQYHTAQLQPYRTAILQAMQVSAETQRIRDAYLNALHIENRSLICIHIRRGDYLLYGPQHDLFWGCSMDGVIDSVVDILKTAIKHPIIYICSDDLDYCAQEFNRRNVPFVSNRNMVEPLSTEQQLQLDFAIMSNCDVLMVSNSTLSISAALLNPTCRAFMRPDQSGEKMIPFDPWNCHVLLSRSGQYNI